MKITVYTERNLRRLEPVEGWERWTLRGTTVREYLDIRVRVPRWVTRVVLWWQYRRAAQKYGWNDDAKKDRDDLENAVDALEREADGELSIAYWFIFRALLLIARILLVQDAR